jgi:hypothetical protein
MVQRLARSPFTMDCNATKRSEKDRLGAIWVQFLFLTQKAACDLSGRLRSYSAYREIGMPRIDRIF